MLKSYMVIAKWQVFNGIPPIKLVIFVSFCNPKPTKKQQSCWKIVIAPDPPGHPSHILTSIRCLRSGPCRVQCGAWWKAPKPSQLGDNGITPTFQGHDLFFLKPWKVPVMIVRPPAPFKKRTPGPAYIIFKLERRNLFSEMVKAKPIKKREGYTGETLSGCSRYNKSK